jgi:hypothetical protein
MGAAEAAFGAEIAVVGVADQHDDPAAAEKYGVVVADVDVEKDGGYCSKEGEEGC